MGTNTDDLRPESSYFILLWGERKFVLLSFKTTDPEDEIFRQEIELLNDQNSAF